ncbi:MAG: nitroreductase family protein [Planctomycetaceae bacterium]|nr:nitroreductase family protein [Planctomycetaceae bacterium]
MKKIIEQRRSYYSIESKSPISDEEIEKLIRLSVKYLPSAFNSQSSRIVLLLHQHHERLWRMVKETLQRIVDLSSFDRVEKKINTFAAGYGTVLYFEDQDVVEMFRKNNPSYADRFPVWSEHAAAIHQFTIWLLLEEAGFGASLQHYNPLIDNEVAYTWDVPNSWKLIAQMPFGTPTKEPEEKVFRSLDSRIRIFSHDTKFRQ